MYNKEIVELRLTDNGYFYFIDVEHPLAVGNSGKVYLHRHVASLSVGRWLSSEEHVHHIDECKTNNHPSNFKILSASEHSKLHMGEVLNKVCLKCAKEFLPDKHFSKYCSPTCADSSRVVNKSLTKEMLEDLIPKHSWVALGKMFGYSDNGIKKRAKALGCNIPKRK